MFKKLGFLGVIFVMVFALAACETNLTGYKTIQKLEIDAYVQALTESDYASADWQEILQIASEGKTKVEAATDKDGVDAAVENTKSAIAIVQREKGMKSISFKLVLGRMDYGEATDIQTIVNSFSEWTALDAITNLPELKDKFNEQFFENKSLVIFAQQRGTEGAQLEKVEVFGQEDQLLVKVFDDGNGYRQAISKWIVVIEVLKSDINTFSHLRLETNFYTFSK